MNVINFLKDNVKPATGCTDPIAVAYGVSLAYHALYGCVPPDFHCSCPKAQTDNVVRLHINTDRDTFKNGKAIMIPGTDGQKGITIAAAMALFLDPSMGLNLFEGASGDIIPKANKLKENNKVTLGQIDALSSSSEIDIQVNLDYLVDDLLKRSYVRLQHKHDAISLIMVDDTVVYEKSIEKGIAQEEKLPDSLNGFIAIIKKLTTEEKNKVYDGLIMNKKIAEEGLRINYGLGLSRHLMRLLQQGVITDTLITKVRIMAAAAGDARMGGVNMPVMSTAGSGNQGITASIPILVVGETNNISKHKMSEAAMLSHLITKYISNHSGYLSALCGCAIKAGIGATAGVTYLLGGTLEHINDAINIMAANITGMVCDGAKEGCALKLSLAAGTATESAFLAINGMKVPGDNGIINERSEETIKNIGKISKAMVSTDIAIVNIMKNK